jgi:hypothetical protein
MVLAIVKSSRVHVGEGAARVHELGRVGDDEEDAAADQQDQHDGPRDRLLWRDGLLGQRGDRIEAQERIGG